MLNNRDRRPTHPGEIIREDVLPGLGVSQGDFAEMLGVSRRTVVEIVAERRSISSDMALRLAHVLGTTPESWLHMQIAVDLWDDLRKHRQEYASLRPAAKSAA
ncbi:MAG: HigA family addiction module antidote protein [Acidobacteria bacterium]|nr:HigA family addiction module antidote protein [Acidobacteriota bacterium]